MPELAPDAPAPPDLAGRHYRIRDHYDVGREKIREFARAVQNSHPAHWYDAGKLGWDGIIAPPTFGSVIGMTITQALLDTVLSDYDLSQVLQTDQVFEAHRPIMAGDRLHSEAVIESVRRVRGNDFIVVKAVLTDDSGAVVLVATTSIVARLGEGDPDIVRLVEGLVMRRRADGPVDPEVLSQIDTDQFTRVPELAESWRGTPVHTEPNFDDLDVGFQLPTATMQLTRGDLVNYAGVSGDPNPIHFSDRAAELAGLPTVVAHGLLTMGLGGQYLTSWLGDPTAIESYSVRLSGYVPVEPLSPARIDFSGKIKALDPERRTATILLSGTSAGKKLFGRAIAQVRLS
ncbi:fused (3R)-hydroxyacyl-ACP dehydratase subunits HadA/HadB [Nocardia blacklockiae]|uniref:fused (3R)-hydroxyacyl-ACP dehydratase subunits HadA/HadB n=1 Tax=Nocardia blacklockiae TaxID=480036 RepID=UPI001896095C|nr:fused (3R)-hydroxyacyl-ACP dehydratase subunits HadA/HadB [Nocardia blacklockiae]MBF6175453.1 MaoC family dehydratase N-terminal domain-containing protein [Nocardia blacklockiae]